MSPEISPLRVLLKALCLFVIINTVYALANPQGVQVSGYNVVFPGRTRLPFGIRGDPYTVTVDYVDAMFASHLIAASKGPREYRIALIGDSSIWGEDLGAYEVISEQWNNLNIQCGDLQIKAYNLGYPHPSAVKDLIILDKATEYEPDLIIWFVTLNTLFSQRINPFLLANRERAIDVVNTYDISLRQRKTLVTEEPSFYDRTLVGRRSNLARQIKLEILGIIWTATGSDTNTLAPDAPVDFHVDNDPSFRTLQPSDDVKPLLQLSALQAGAEIADPIPLLIVNEPIYIVDEAVSQVRYNVGYPRWVYDQYREAIATQAGNAGWQYLDLWSAIPREYFSDAGLHLSLEGERLLVQQINPAVQSIACDTKP
ncbi:MAG TPA: SGNH/GDSL hydrolase family protein [Anaerolineales bacterium]|nr:SGNH/GDSL hydrolase family protein [Anaerolineales bacterium]